MCSCTLAFVAALLLQRADPPPPDTCCLTYGQVQEWIRLEGYIPTTAVSQCLDASATVKIPPQIPENCFTEGTAENTADSGLNPAEFRFIEDLTVGVKRVNNKDKPWLLCLQWKAVEKKVREDKRTILLLYDGKPYGSDNLEKFQKLMKKNDVVILVMRYVREKKTCEIAQIHVIPVEKVTKQ
jgi:hypothetical protein